MFVTRGFMGQGPFFGQVSLRMGRGLPTRPLGILERGRFIAGFEPPAGAFPVPWGPDEEELKRRKKQGRSY